MAGSAMHELNAGSVRANNVLFHYLTMGEGPLLLCLHGFPDHAYSFHRQLSDFSALGYRVVAPFMRGYAPTETPKDATFFTADLAHDVVELVQSLGVTRATLLGHDWGAHAAYAAAVLAPDMFDHIVALAAPSGPGFRSALQTSAEQQRRSWYIFFFQSNFSSNRNWPKSRLHMTAARLWNGSGRTGRPAGSRRRKRWRNYAQHLPHPA
jgi:pimeloyl-ACP methyl ester carboxylesterase